MTDREKSEIRRTHPKAEKVERLEHLIELMAAGFWEPGVTAPVLASTWGLELWAVEQLAVEAKRTVQIVTSALADLRADKEATAKALSELKERVDALENRAGGKPGALELALRGVARNASPGAIELALRGERPASSLAASEAEQETLPKEA